MTTAIDRQTTRIDDEIRGGNGQLEAHEHPPRLAHHFDSMRQQYEAAKLGMWLFLATEMLLFGGLFCVYAVFRFNHPDLFAWGSQFLNVKFGAINTVVLIVSSCTMAMAVSCAQMNRRWAVIILMGVTMICGVMFMAIKSVEYEVKFRHHLVWGVGFYDGSHEGEEDVATTALAPSDVARGTELWHRTCRSCHGLGGEGVTGQGRDIRSSEFIQGLDDLELVAFIKTGRAPTDPLNTTGLLMPPKGANPLLKDQELIDIVGYVRSFQIPLAPDGDETAPGEEDEDAVVPDDAGADDSAPPEVAAAPVDAPEADGFWIPRSSLPLAPAGPPGVNPALLLDADDRPIEPPETMERPANAHIFFGIYFVMTGLHAIHVLAGIGLIGWLVYRMVWGHFDGSYYTPIDLGGLYWHVVDLIWIFLFPLFYLIG